MTGPGRRHAVAAVAALAALLAGCGDNPTVQGQPPRSVLDMLAGDSSFERFLEAANRGQVAAILTGPGPVTVFAFTDSGWDDLPVFTREALLAGSDQLRLQALMNSLIVDGRVTVAGIAGQTVTLTSRNGTRLEVDARDPQRVGVSSAGGRGMSVGLGSIGLRSARLLRQDIAASNGIIHVLDGMVVP